MALKVKKAPLPIKVLSELDKKTAQQLKKLMDSGLAVLYGQLAKMKPTPLKHLRKAFSPVDHQKIRDYNRRLLHGGPLTQVQLNDDEIKELLALLPLKGVDPGSADMREPVESGEYEEEIVPLSAIKYGDFTLLQLQKALKGGGQTIYLTKQGDLGEYWTEAGAASVFARLITGVPAVLARVQNAGETTHTQEITPEDISRHEAEARALIYTKDRTYHLPSYLEPLAEQARKHGRGTLEFIWGGEEVPEERKARQVRVDAEARRDDAWGRLFQRRIDLGDTAEEANKATRKDPAWERAEESAETAYQREQDTKAHWEEARREFKAAVNQTLEYLKEDGEELKPFTLGGLYNETKKAKRLPKDNSMSTGTLEGTYQRDEEVEIRDTRGKWLPGVVVKAESHSVKVKRADQQYRTVEDPTAIRRPGEGKLSLDNGEETGYNSDMTQIVLPKFNVLIPLGSNALKLERALEPITDEMNKTPLIVNRVTWARNRDSVAEELAEATKACHEAAGKPFRPNSPKDVRSL